MKSSAAPAPEVVELRENLADVLDDVRSGRFGKELTDKADKVFARRELFRTYGDELSHGRIHSLCAEIYDQAGNYAASVALLEPLMKEREYLPYICAAQAGEFAVKGMNEADLANGRRLARQKVMCCLAYGFALYRTRKSKQAQEVFTACEQFLNKVLVDKDSKQPFYCWGAQARLHYFFGQLLRTDRDFAASRARFVTALECAHDRIREKKKKPVVQQLFANHCAAKVLAFGFGWTALLGGELTKALEQIQAARISLSDSQDEYLNWQVEMLCCAALRAKIGIKPELEALIPRLLNCRDKLKEHNEYYWQAQHELAVLYLNVARSKKDRSEQSSRDNYLHEARDLANEAIRQFSRNADESFRQTYRSYVVLAKVLASRIAAAGKEGQWSKAAYELARSAYTLAKDESLPSHVQAEAAIGLGEALKASAEAEDLKEACACLEEALAASADNVLVRSACLLHLAEVNLDLNIYKARRWLATWEQHARNVEHGWLQQKAEFLKKVLAARKVYLVEYGDKRKLKQLNYEFFQFLVDRERVRQGGKIEDYQVAAENIGISVRTLQDWIYKLGKSINIARQFRISEEDTN